ncbi:MAG: hypothetical protein HC896_17035 [Bacteroidales bacterium]|nr:hypothetical protein [Bacteroidales bacterium]
MSNLNFYPLFNETGGANMFESYLSWKHRVTSNFSMVGGVHYLYFDLNDEMLLEPRFSAAWQFLPKHALNVGFGLHSKHEPLHVYFARDTTGCTP